MADEKRILTRSVTKLLAQSAATADAEGNDPKDHAKLNLDVAERSTADSQRANSRNPSPCPTIVSARSHRSTTSTLKRQKIVELQLQAAEQAAELDRKALEIQKQLIFEKLRIETDNLSEVSDDCASKCSSMPRQKAQPTAADAAAASKTPASYALTQFCSKRNPSTYERDEHPRAPERGDMGKFMARQTSIKELPIFSGDPEDWPLFYSQFKSTTRLCGYSDDENIARLAKCLRGKARDAVSALLVSATNLTKIIDTLRLRFGRPEYIVEVMLNKLRLLREIRHDDVNGLIEYATSVQNIVALMTSTDESGQLTNTSLIREVIAKLPSIVKYQWSHYLSERESTQSTLIDLSEWLMKIATAATAIAPMPKSNDRTQSTTTTKPNSTNTTSRPQFLHQKHTVFTTTSRARTCSLCQQEHGLDSCPDFLRMTTDERWKLVTEKKLCFSCLSARHQIKACKRKKKCTSCERAHHSTLHAEPVPIVEEPAAVNHVTEDGGTILLKVAPVVIKGPTGEVETLALLDEGSSISLIDEKLVSRVGASGPTRQLHMQGASGMTVTERSSQTVSLEVRGINSSDFLKLSNVNSVNNLCLPLYKCNYKKLVKDWTYLTDYIMNIDKTVYDRPMLLIGHDNIDLIVTRQVVQGPKNAPLVSFTRLGPIVHGKLPGSTPSCASVLHVCECQELNEAIRRTFSTESFGTKATSDTPRSREDMRALDIMQKTTKLVGNRWETGLLWREDHLELPDSYPVARKRLSGVQNKMKRFPEFAARYKEKFVENLEKGYFAKLSDQERQHKTWKTWYLPHFAVFNPNKPNKLRIVQDCAAPSMGKSLNDFLLSGPDLLTSLPGVLLGFRCGKIAIMGDIQEMFHRVLIREEDRQAQRLLWDDGEYVMNVMTFGSVCSPSSSQFVKNLNARRFQSTYPEAVKAIVDHHYVDDFIFSVDSESDAERIVDDVILVHGLGGFNMRNFMSNSKQLLRHLAQDKLAPGGVKLLSDLEEEHIERVLGVNWDPDTDNFTYRLKFHKVEGKLVTGEKRPTKREVLRLIMSVFDPLGFLLYMTVKGRIIFQDVWRSKIGWDDEIESSIYDRWQTWLKELVSVCNVTVPRWMMTDDCDINGPVELHVFCDASSRAFCAVAYLRRKTMSDSWHVSFVMARARVAPLKTLSVPRLELQAAVMGARLAQVLRKYVDTPSTTISRTYFWSDSKTVLSWLRSDTGRFKPFVAHRISEIAELTSPHDWRWVPSAMNAADDATRDGLVDGSRWLIGPTFLLGPDEDWPQEDKDSVFLDPSDCEVKLVCPLQLESLSESLPNDQRFSLYWRLIRSTAWVQRFIHNLRHANAKRTGELAAEEVSAAEILWLKQSQRRTYPSEIHDIKKNGLVSKTSSLRQLTPYMDTDGLLRVGGRIERADIGEDAKHPIILHQKDRLTLMLIHQYHKDAAHVGRETVLNNLRQRFWVTNGRSAVKSVWNLCQVCKNKRATPVPPLMGQLPVMRLEPKGRAFTFTGIDYFGPMTVKVGRRHEKRYGALFTCLTVRAVHIELVQDLTTGSAIMALRRFIARRGSPKEIWSDNATTFRGAERELKNAVLGIEHAELERFGSLRQIKWNFIVPNSPHMGGCWERLIRSTKTALKVTLKETAPSDQTLQTLLAEVEFMINSRPLTHVPLDHADDLPLTPNHFLLTSTTHLDYQTGAQTTDGDSLRLSFKQAQRLTDLIWRRWVKEYLPSLTRRDKWFGPAQPLAVGDVVVIADDQMPRNLWVKGIISRTYPGRDGQVRAADVMTGQDRRTYTRPAVKLCRLDVRSSS